jgi:predicted outer membrane protein
MLHSYSLIAVAAVAAVGLGLAGEDKAAPKPKVEAVSPVGVISPQENDRRIARWLVVDNDGLRGCAAMVEDHSSNVRVKEMARSIVADHKRMDARLNAFTGVILEETRATEASKTATLLKDDGRSRDNRFAFKPTDFLAVKESVCKGLRSKAEEEFKSLKGTEFDDAFLAHMVIGHEALIANIDAVRNDSTQQLQTTLDEFRDLSVQHLKNVRSLRKAQHPETANR